MKFVFPALAAMLLLACNSSTAPSDTAKATEKDSSTVYAGPHHYQHAVASAQGDNTEQQWDSINGITPVEKTDFDHVAHPDQKIFGWHMYSSGTAYKEYNFSLMWAVSYFCYEVDASTGSYKSIHDWRTTELIDRAKSSGCKVMLTAGVFGSSDNSKFLSSPAAQSRFEDSLVALLKFRNADGVTIDFEGITSSSKDNFSKFINGLSAKLKAADPKYMLTLALYAVDYQKVFDIKSINDAVDVYIIMGYDYYGGFSSNAGPSSPLNISGAWGTESLERSVDYYLSQGVQPSKLILGLAYYGNQWEVDHSALPSKVKKFDKTLAYHVIQKTYSDSLHYPVKLNKETSSSYYSFTDAGGTMKQVWYEDTVSLGMKYDYIKSKGLAGTGIWALGYDHGRTELWDLLGRKFGKRK